MRESLEVSNENASMVSFRVGKMVHIKIITCGLSSLGV